MQYMTANGTVAASPNAAVSTRLATMANLTVHYDFQRP
jgi:hypothetical protein